MALTRTVITKDMDADLKELASRLPPVGEESVENQWVKGSEILSWNTVKELDGKPIDPEKTYLYATPLIMAANHYRRLRKAMQKDGNEGVHNYILSVNNIIESNQVKDGPTKKAIPQEQVSSNKTRNKVRFYLWWHRILSAFGFQ